MVSDSPSSPSPHLSLFLLLLHLLLLSFFLLFVIIIMLRAIRQFRVGITDRLCPVLTLTNTQRNPKLRMPIDFHFGCQHARQICQHS